MNAMLALLGKLLTAIKRKPVAPVNPVTSESAPLPATITVDQLAVAMSCTPAISARWLPHLLVAAETYGIDTPVRLAAWIAQIGHESGGLRYAREIWGPTAAQSRYEGRADLGNTEPGDGRRYCGRGLIQTTGRANYRAARDGLRAMSPDAPDFEARPELLELPRWAALSAGLYWRDHGCNELADVGNFLAITRRINGGTNGLADRQARHIRARSVLGVA